MGHLPTNDARSELNFAANFRLLRILAKRSSTCITIERPVPRHGLLQRGCWPSDRHVQVQDSGRIEKSYVHDARTHSLELTCARVAVRRDLVRLAIRFSAPSDRSRVRPPHIIILKGLLGHQCPPFRPDHCTTSGPSTAKDSYRIPRLLSDLMSTMQCGCICVRTTYLGCAHLHGGKPVVQEERSRSSRCVAQGNSECTNFRVREETTAGNCQQHGSTGRRESQT